MSGSGRPRTLLAMTITVASSIPDGSIVTQLPFNSRPAIYGDNISRRLSIADNGDGYVGFPVLSPTWANVGESIDIEYPSGIVNLFSTSDPGNQDLILLPFAAYLWQNQNATLTITPYVPSGLNLDTPRDVLATSHVRLSYNQQAEYRWQNVQSTLKLWVGPSMSVNVPATDGSYSSVMSRANPRTPIKTSFDNFNKVTLTID